MECKGKNDLSQMIVGEYIGIFYYSGITYLVARVREAEDPEMVGNFVVRAASDEFSIVAGEIFLKSNVSPVEDFEDLSKYFEEILNSDDTLQNGTEAQDVLDVCNEIIRKLTEGKQVNFGYNYGGSKLMLRGSIWEGKGIAPQLQITAGEYIGVFDCKETTYLVARVSEAEDSEAIGKFVVRAASIDVFPNVGGEIVLNSDTSSPEDFEDLSEYFEKILNSDDNIILLDNEIENSDDNLQNVRTLFQGVLEVCNGTVSKYNAYYTYVVENAVRLTATSFHRDTFTRIDKKFKEHVAAMAKPENVLGPPKRLVRRNEAYLPQVPLTF